MRTRVVERRALREAGSLEVMVACWKIELVLIEKLLILIFIGLCYRTKTKSHLPSSNISIR